MSKSFLYEEFIIEKDILLKNNEIYNSELRFIFNGKKNKINKLVLICKFELINNKNYILETKVIKYLDNEKETSSGIFIHHYTIKENDVINLDLILNIICELNTTTLNETVCGFKDLKNNTLSLKLWKDKDFNYCAGLTTSYIIEDETYDFIIVGGGPAGIYSAYKISEENPESKILLLEDNPNTDEEYKLRGYDKTDKRNLATYDPDYQKSYTSDDNKTIWVGKGLGGGTLHFGLQYINNISKNYEEWKNNYDIIDKDLNPQKYEYKLIENDHNDHEHNDHQNDHNDDENKHNDHEHEHDHKHEHDNEHNDKVNSKMYLRSSIDNYKPNSTWYKFKENLDKFFNNTDVDVYNNTVYSTDLDNLDRLLVGDLIKDVKNIKIQYNSKVDKLIFREHRDNSVVDSVKTFDNKYYKSKNIILCCGALETPCILQRSDIDCGNKLYDHGAIIGLSYGKLNIQNIEPPKDEEKYFRLNSINLELINQESNRYVFISIGDGLPSEDIDNIYDFTEWVRFHPGGSNSIKKWRDNNNILVYPHNSSRWLSHKSYFTYIGKKDELIQYKNLPENLKSDELFNKIIWDNDINKTNKIALVDDLGFENNKIISHLQTRDKDLSWQTYYSTVPGYNNVIILTHSQSIDLEGKGSVKINSKKNENPKIILNHFGDEQNKVLDQIYDAYIKNHNFLTSNGYILLAPSPIENPINKEYIKNNFDSIYHYHGSCAIGEVVDENQKVYNVSNLYIGDISVLPKPWGGSTSYAALNTALNVSKNFIKNN